MAASTNNNLLCSLKQCKYDNVINILKDKRVEVKTFQLSNSDLIQVENPDKFDISWSKNSDAIFHVSCWEQVLTASRCRSKKRSPLPKMTAREQSMVKEAAKTAELFSSLETINGKAETIAKLIKDSKHCVVFTGAGISTSAGIGDYRGKDGKWTNEDRQVMQDEPSPKKARYENDDESETSEQEVVDFEKLMPTYTHEAIKKLVELGYIKHVISQNCDGLHGLSGVPTVALSELHGNVFMETCERCQTRYERPYYVMDDVASQYFEEMSTFGETDLVKPPHIKMCKRCHLTHRTGRKCENQKCNGYLLDTIINFCDHLDKDVLGRATLESQNSDVMVCLGTSLTVTPANELVEMTKEPQRIIICNRQTTFLDAACEKHDPDGVALGCRVWGDCDVLMKEVMKFLLPPEELRTWEQGKEERLECFAKQRKAH